MFGLFFFRFVNIGRMGRLGMVGRLDLLYTPVCCLVFLVIGFGMEVGVGTV
jgi:hypothetical protein